MLECQLNKTKDNFGGHVVHPNWVISLIDFMVGNTLHIEAKRPKHFPLQCKGRPRKSADNSGSGCARGREFAKHADVYGYGSIGDRKGMKVIRFGDFYSAHWALCICKVVKCHGKYGEIFGESIETTVSAFESVNKVGLEFHGRGVRSKVM